MTDLEAVIQTIRDAFGANEYPGANYLQDSDEGCEPFDEVGPFQGKEDWKTIGPDFLDAQAGALSFFSQAGLRFFLPAYLIADLRGLLKIADPLFCLTHGFSDVTVEAPAGRRVFTLRIGKSQFVNPKRYGAATFGDYARYRLAVFAREEAKAIVAYLEYKRDSDPGNLNKEAIDAALQSYWLERSQTAPPTESLRNHLTQQNEFLAAIKDNG